MIFLSPANDAFCKKVQCYLSVVQLPAYLHSYDISQVVR
jgi:hypothetical protein